MNRFWSVLLFASTLLCCCSIGSSQSAKHSAHNKSQNRTRIMDTSSNISRYPNIYVKLRVSRLAPEIPKQEGLMDFWIKENKVHIRDETGRYLYEILGDVSEEGGLGYIPSSLEEMMDIHSRFSKESPKKIIELYANLESNSGRVAPEGKEPYGIDTKEIVSIIDQIFLNGQEKKLKETGNVTLFEKNCSVYQGILKVEIEGETIMNKAKMITFESLLLLSDIRDVEDNDHYYLREIVGFSIGTVTDEQVEMD